jgi:pilus assembly protein CpaB
VSRRARALSFLLAALLCAALAASLASGYGARLERRYGQLRSVVVAGEELPAGKPIEGRQAQALELRRVPARFVPAAAISTAEEALGRVPAAVVPAGAYVLAPQLGAPGSDSGRLGLASGRSPVEIAVSGAEALASGDAAGGSVVDVVVTEESDAGAPGRTYVAAHGVQLLDLRRGGEAADGGAGPRWTATLALTHAEALKLIAAENFARQVRLLPR